MSPDRHSLEAIKVQQIKKLVYSIEKDFNPDVLLDIQRMLQKAVEYAESTPKHAFEGASDAKQANKDSIILALRSALEKNKKAHYLLAEAFDAIKNLKYNGL